MVATVLADINVLDVGVVEEDEMSRVHVSDRIAIGERIRFTNCTMVSICLKERFTPDRYWVASASHLLMEDSHFSRHTTILTKGEKRTF